MFPRKTAVAMAASVLFAAGGATAYAQGAGSADRPSDTAIVNGVTMLGCQYTTPEVPADQCTNLEQLTTDDPVLLKLAPLTTAIVTLGAGLHPDGGIRPVLEDRLKTTYRLATTYPLAPVIVTGGAPRNGVSEARAMFNWLVGAGIDPNRITMEDRSGSTVQNAQFTQRIIEERGLTGAVVVTNDFHLLRAMTNFRQYAGGKVPVAGVVATP